MALPSVSDFRDRFPEFSEASDAAITTAIDDAGDEIDEDIWMTKYYPKGVLFLAAHFLAIGATQAELVEDGGGTGSGGSSSGGIASESLGRFSVSYDTSQSTSNSSASSGSGLLDLTLTAYGQRYLDMVKRNNPRLLIV